MYQTGRAVRLLNAYLWNDFTAVWSQLLGYLKLAPAWDYHFKILLCTTEDP